MNDAYPRLIGISQAKRDLSRIAQEVSQSGEPIIVLKGSKPIVQIAPVDGTAEVNDVKSSETV